MTMRAKLLAALAGITSQNPVSTETLAQGHSMRSVKSALMELYQERQVCCCEFYKGDAKPVVKWWLAGSVGGVLPQTANHNRKTQAARAAKSLDGDGDE